MTRRILLLIGAFIIGLVFVSNLNEAVSDSIAYIMKRFTNFTSDLNGARMSSTKYRIIGHLELFNQSLFSKDVWCWDCTIWKFI